MRFEININKKHLILLVVLFAFVSLVIAQNGNYNPGHSGDQISVRNSNLATVIDTMVATTSILSQRVDAHTDQITALESAPSFEIVGEGTKTINSPRFISEGTEWVNLLDSRDFRLSGTQWSENTYLVVISDLSINNQFEHMSSSFIVNMVPATNSNNVFSLIPSSTSSHNFAGENMLEFRFLARTGQAPGLIQMRFTGNPIPLPPQITIPYKIIHINDF